MGKAESKFRRILVVGPDPSVVEAIRNAGPEDRGVVLVEKSSPAAATETVRGAEIDIVIEDRVSDSDRQLQELCAQQSVPWVPVLPMARASDCISELEGGAAACLISPLQAESVQALVDAAVQGEVVAGSSEAVAQRANVEGAAALIQRSLIPGETVLSSLDAQLGLTVTHESHALATVTGDAWGAAPLDDHRVSVFVADVAGHGWDAGIWTFHLYELMAGIGEIAGNPAAVLGHLNVGLAQRTAAHDYLALIYCVIDTQTDRVTYAAADMPPPKVIDPTTARVGRGDGTGLPLGIDRNVRYENRFLDFHPGSALLVHTDGLNSLKLSDDTPLSDSGVVAILEAGMRDGRLDVHGDCATLVSLFTEGREPVMRDDLAVVFCARTEG